MGSVFEGISERVLNNVARSRCLSSLGQQQSAGLHDSFAISTSSMLILSTALFFLVSLLNRFMSGVTALLTIVIVVAAQAVRS